MLLLGGFLESAAIVAELLLLLYCMLHRCFCFLVSSACAASCVSCVLLLFAAPMIAFVSAARTLLSISAALVTAGAHAFATHVSAALASAALASALLCLFFLSLSVCCTCACFAHVYCSCVCLFLVC